MNGVFLGVPRSLETGSQRSIRFPKLALML